MRVVSRLGTGGLFAEDVLLGGSEGLPAGCVASRPPEGFHAPRWTGSAWEEGKPAAEILAAAKEAKRSELKAAFGAQHEPVFEAGFLEVDYLLRRLSLNLAVPQAERDRLQAVGAGIDRLRSLLARVGAATTEAEVGAVSW